MTTDLKDKATILQMTKQNIEFIIEEIDEPEVPSEFQKVSQSQADIYYKFRYTFPEGEIESNRNAILKAFIKQLRRFMIGGKYVAGIECFKTGMVDARPHLHLHFVSRTKRDTISKWLRRHDDPDMPALHGNRCYALSVETVVNGDKFWRYPLKQQKNDTQRTAYSEGFTKEEVARLRDEAYAVWITSCEVQNKKIEKKEDADALSDRLYKYLDKLDKKDNLSIKVGIQKFYILEEQKPFNKTTALGYFYNYKIMRGLMTHEELASTW